MIYVIGGAIAFFLWFVYKAIHSPDGYEDKEGYHEVEHEDK